MKAIQELIAAIGHRIISETDKIKKVEKLAKKVLKEKKTLDFIHAGSTPLEVASYNDSVAVFSLLIKLGADPFYKPKHEQPSVIDYLADRYAEPRIIIGIDSQSPKIYN